ncbi:MAG: OmpA family protein [Candidatus Poribacteria bacterium]|nr:OmpA family protein [Candidatus Poribacteria bacterium]MDE0504026.1 OmpA family protein [Candidatus Poribacteria bacterium]
MRNMTVVMAVSVLVCGAILSGCGKLSTEEFEGWRSEYVASNDKAFADMDGRASKLESGLDQQKSDLSQSIEDARDDAIAASQLGDADTIKRSEQFAMGEDAKLRDELMGAVNAAGESAQSFAKSEDDKLRKSISSLEKQANSTAQSVSDLESDLMAAKKELADAMAVKAMSAATVQFASGKTGLSSEAKAMLDKAVASIKAHPHAVVVVSGHADGTPVLSGKYRSNWDLSQARANSVANYLKESGVTNEIKTLARGHTMPAANVNTKDGRAANRRAEVVVYPPGTMPAGM